MVLKTQDYAFIVVEEGMELKTVLIKRNQGAKPEKRLFKNFYRFRKVSEKTNQILDFLPLLTLSREASGRIEDTTTQRRI
mmetsp:Transcript_303/g.522  ORF Transcript_303/g.522 Transcript_303/m.522 type:complete len:80 (-) Transcript_303:19-258(-)